MKLYKVILLFFALILSQSRIAPRANAQLGGLLPSDSFSSSQIIGNGDKADQMNPYNDSDIIKHNFTISGKSYSVTFASPIDVRNGGFKAVDDGLGGVARMHSDAPQRMFQMQPVQGNSGDVGAYYLRIYPVDYRAVNDPVLNARIYTKQPKTGSSCPQDTESFSNQDTYCWYWADGNNKPNIVAYYLKLMHDVINNNKSFSPRDYIHQYSWSKGITNTGGTTTETDQNLIDCGKTVVATDKDGLTTKIVQSDAFDSSKVCTWWYVATVTLGKTLEINAVFRQAEKPDHYILINSVGGIGSILAYYYPDKGPNWIQTNTTGGVQIKDYHEPNQPDLYFTASPIINMEPIFDANFDRKKYLDSPSRDMTVEVRLGSDGKGPFITAVQSHLVDKDKTSTDRQSATFPTFALCDFDKTGKNSDISIITSDIASKYGVPSDLAISDMQIYGFTSLSGDNTAPFLEADQSVNIPSDFRNSGSDTNHKVLIDAKRTFDARKTNTLKHPGDEEEKSLAERAKDAVTPAITGAGNIIKNAILNALKAVALVIQQIIITFALWIIGLVSGNVPI